jgi:putative acetyltransferase
VRMIRSERSGDIENIRLVNQTAFGTTVEANLVDNLRKRDKLIVSLVAEEDGVLVGHIAFSAVRLESHPQVRGVGLGPMAVIPSMQRQEIGSDLVVTGLERCRTLGYHYVVVLGHPQYYPRFGFLSAQRYGITCSWEVPEGVFMVLELTPGALAGVSGLAQYEPEFNEA